jgi:hypothetical protein
MENTAMSAPVDAPLNSFKNNRHSQFGEDGIIEEVLRRIAAASTIDKWCVEFGAWDGKHLSNTYDLISNKGYKAVLIEGDRAKYQLLCKNIPRPDVFKVCEFVTFDGESSLDNILKRTPIPVDFDILSVDIDGCDYHVFESLSSFKPKIVCIEFNPTIPNEVEFVQPRDFNIKQGASAKALITLAAKKGYSLVSTTFCNAIFVRDDLSQTVVGPQQSTLEDLRDDSEFKTFLFVGYDGTILSNKANIRLPWHGLSPDLNRFQQLPKSLRQFLPDYGFFKKVAFVIFLFVRHYPALRNHVSKILGGKN